LNNTVVRGYEEHIDYLMVNLHTKPL